MKHEPKGVEELLRELPVVRAPEGFEARLEERLAAEVRPAPRPVFPEPPRGARAVLAWRLPAWAAALPLLVAVLWVRGPRGPWTAGEKGAPAPESPAAVQFAWMFYPDEAHLQAAIDLLEQMARKHPEDPTLPLKLIELYRRQLRRASPEEAGAIRAKLAGAWQRARELTARVIPEGADERG